VIYRMTLTAMTLIDPEGHVCCLKPFSSYTLGNIARVRYDEFTCESQSAYDLQFQPPYWNWRTI